MDRIGQSNVPNACRGKDLGFTEFRAADTDGAGLDLAHRNRRRLVGFGVRAQANASGARPCLHGADIALESSAIDGHERGGERRQRCWHRRWTRASLTIDAGLAIVDWGLKRPATGAEGATAPPGCPVGAAPGGTISERPGAGAAAQTLARRRPRP